MPMRRFEGLAGFGFAEAVERARGYLRVAEDYVPQAVDQLRGMAEGASVPFEHLLALNCSEEFTCRPTSCGRRALHVVRGRRRRAAVAGHNEDWYPEEIRARPPHRATDRSWVPPRTSAPVRLQPADHGGHGRGVQLGGQHGLLPRRARRRAQQLLLTTVLGQPDLEHARTCCPRSACAGVQPSVLRRRMAGSGTWRRAASAGHSWTVRRARRRRRRRHGPLRARQPLRVA